MPTEGNRGGRPVTHAATWLARRLQVNRLEPHTRRMLNKLQRELHCNTWETLRALILGRLARRELIAQQREAALLGDANAEGGKWLLGLWAAQRRDVEMLALLERIAKDDDRVPTLDEYLRQRSSNGHATAQADPLASTSTAVDADPTTTPADAADAAARSDGITNRLADRLADGRPEQPQSR